MHRIHRSGLLMAVALTVPLIACSGSGPDGTTSEAVAATGKTLPQALDDMDGAQTVAEALKDTGLAGIFDGNGSYTLLAPQDDAFDSLGDAGRKLTRSEDRPALAALLKDHIVPGYLTPKDIEGALAASGSAKVTMRAMSGVELTFARSGSSITVSRPDGVTARIDGEAIGAGSSVAIPISAVLKEI